MKYKMTEIKITLNTIKSRLDTAEDITKIKAILIQIILNKSQGEKVLILFQWATGQLKA